MLFILKAFQFPLPYNIELGHSRARDIYLLCLNEPYYTIKTKVLGENGIEGIRFDANGFLKIGGHLLRRTAKKCPRRIPDTPVVLFCLTP